MVNRHPRSILATCTATALLFQSSGLLAQSAPADEPGTEAGGVARDTYLTPIVRSSGQNDPYRIPAATSTISADEIEQFGGKNLDDVIRATPGTFTRDNVQNPGVAVNIRGLEGSGRVNMMIDGVRQNFRFTGHEAQGLTYMDSAFLAGIDITRGYVAGAGGGNALMGAVNFRTYDIDDLIDAGKNYGGFATATYGTNQAGWAEAAIGAYKFDDSLGVLGGISKRDSGNYDNGSGERVPFTESDLISGLFKIEFTPSDEHRFELSANLLNDDFLANSYFQTIKSRIYNFGYSYDPGNDLFDLKINAYRSDLLMNYDDSPLFAGGGSALGREIEDTGTGFDVTNTSRFNVGEVAVRSSYGFEYFTDDYDVINSTASPASGVNGSGENTNYSIFSSTEFSYGIAALTVGLRYDRYQLEGSGAVAAGNPLGMPAGPYSVDRSDGRVNPSVTLALDPTDWFQPYVTYAETSRPPTINETFVGGTHPGVGPMRFFPNPFLEPEISKGWEIGANFNFEGVLDAGDTLQVKVDYFNNRIDNYITAAFTAGGGMYFDNVAGTSTVQGIELQAAYDAGRYFGSIAYTYTDSDLPSQTNGLGAQSYLPEHVFTATAGARFLEQKLTLGGRLYAVSESYVGEVNVGPGQSPYEPGYGLVDLFANYKFENGIELSANVSNVFDNSYTPALSTPPGGSTVDTGRGRTFFITAKAKF